MTRAQQIEAALASKPIHPLAAEYRLLKGGELDELADDIGRRGLIHPIVVHKNQIIDGRNRLVACHLVGIEPKFVEYAGNEEDIPRYLVSANDHRRHETRGEKQCNIKRLLKLEPAQSNNTIAKKVGCSDKTVDAARKKMEATSEIPKLMKRTGKDGKPRKAPASRKPKPVIGLGDKLPVIEAQIVEEPKPKQAPARSHSRPARWTDALSRALDALRELADIQSEYEEWRNSLPENFQDGALSEKLDVVCELDFANAIEILEEAHAIDLPLGLGRD